MITVFFTFGQSFAYPYRDGWVEVHAPSKECAIAVFKAMYPLAPHWAGLYTADEFFDTTMAKNGNYGKYCHETITITNCKCN